MARIRTVKPEFWSDEKLTECSLSARLMFIGMLNFSDDNGNQPYSAKRLKMQIFPADSIETQPLLDELIAHGVVIEYEVNSEKFLHIKGFSKHQVVNRPSKTKIPKPGFMDQSQNTHGVLTDGREGKGKDVIPDSPTSQETSLPDSENPSPIPSIPFCPIDTLIGLYSENLPTLPTVRKSLFAAGKNGEAMRQRWKWVMSSKHEKGSRAGERLATTAGEGIDWFRRFFGYVAESDFLTGKSGKWGKCDLGWLMTASNFEKILQGNYDNKAQAA